MDIRLYLNDTLVDLPEDIGRQLRLSKSGADASDLESRVADHSYTFSLPDTRVNNAVFRNTVEHVKSRKFFSLLQGSARLEVAGEPILNGAFRLKSIQAGYSVQLVSTDVDLFGLLANKTLRDLNFASWAYKGQYDFTTLLDLPIGEGPVCFPLVAYGNFFSGENLVGTATAQRHEIIQPIEQDDYTPSVYLVAIIKQIFADLGWQAVGEPLTDPEWVKRCIPFTGEEYKWNWQELLKLEAVSANISGNDFARTSPLEDEDGKYTYIQVLQPAPVYNPIRRYRRRTQPAIAANFADLAWDAYLTRVAGLYATTLQLQVNTLSDSVGGVFTIELIRVPAGRSLAEAEVLDSIAVSGSGFVTLTSPLSMLEETDLLLPVIRLRNNSSQGVNVNVQLSDIAFTITPTEEIGPLEITIQENLPELNQRDLVKAFCTMANLRFVLDNTRQVITFCYRDRFELSADFALDLTHLADPKQNEYLPAIDARIFSFAWAEDSSDVLRPVGYGDKVINTGNENAEGKVGLELPFAATVARDYVLRENGFLYRTFSLPAMATTDQLNSPLNDVSWEYGYMPRLISYEGPSETPYRLPLAFLGDFFDRFRYGKASIVGNTWEELYARYYAGYFDGMAKGHITKNSFALSPALYRKLSPQRPILFDGVLYRLGKVNGYQPASLATTEMELIYIEPVAFGGGKPELIEEMISKEFYNKEFYNKEFY